MVYKRTIEKQIESFLEDQGKKNLFVWGPRRSGKTTLLTKLAAAKKVKIFNFDFISEQEFFVNDREALSKLVKDNPLILIDEIQNYPESTLILKILADNFKVKIIATGSSELRKKTQAFDSLAGRYEEAFCLPLSLAEFEQYDQPKAYEKKPYFGLLAKKLMLYGCYPEINTLVAETQKIETLQKILDSYVLKDIIDIYNLKNAKLAKDILVKLALQIGQEVSLNEIANSLGANVSTVSSYVEIFVKNYVLIPLPSFKTNLRRAVSENKKYYFFDLGVRNILIKDFRDLNLRPDSGSLFENLVVSEVEKARRNRRLHFSLYFYREYGGKEVDLVVEDFKKKYRCFEIKLTGQKPPRRVFPLAHKLSLINRENYFEFIPSPKQAQHDD